MNQEDQREQQAQGEDFSRQAQGGQVGFFAEFLDFLLHLFFLQSFSEMQA